uniref:Uncharacterized protein n=1 Tax=Arundo donax TaxID=35708 RepID=A0A0A9EJW3_ARUDO
MKLTKFQERVKKKEKKTGFLFYISQRKFRVWTNFICLHITTKHVQNISKHLRWF